MDEPAAGVNRTLLLNDLLAVIRQLRDEGRTILIVEHDMKVVMGSASASSSSTTGRGSRKGRRRRFSAMGGSSRPISAAEVAGPRACGRPLPVGSAAGPLSAVVALAVAATAAVALWLTGRSLGWPLVHDGPLMHYVAARLLAGAAPYRDLFDMNFPGVYLVHALALLLLGPGDGGFRAFDLLLLAATVAGLGAGLAAFGRGAVAAGGALFWLYHVAGGAWRAGQRDLILCVPLAWLLAAVLAHLRTGSLTTLALAALSLGAAVWIKPHAVLLLPVLVALAWRRGAGRRARAGLAVALGLALPATVVLAWLALSGGLAAFLDIVGGYLVPLYARLGRASLGKAVGWYELGVPIFAGLSTWAVAGGVVLWRADRADRRMVMLAAGVVYGALHFVLQGKGWEYHLYPFALFGVALGAAGLGVALASGRRLAATALVVALLVTAGGLLVKGRRNLDPAWIAEKRARAQVVAAAVRPLVGAGGTVQVLDTTEGGVHALYLLGARQPTRFLYDFHFYHDVDHPYVRRLRAELLEELSARPPAVVVLFERGWPSGGYERLASFPALMAWLEEGYRVAREGEGYRVYAARGDR